MGMIDQAITDIQRITSDASGFGVSLAFVDPDGDTATINGLHAKIHMAMDTEGNTVNSKKAHISFSEAELNAQGYVIRNAARECSMKDHKVTVSDSTGQSWQYIIREVYPDETVGLIVCILGDFE